MTSPLILALDLEPDAALDLAKKLNPEEVKLKVGSKLFTSSGPPIISDLHNLGFDIFLDLKFHDIPNTVIGALRSAMALRPMIVNVHASGGVAMLRAAAKTVFEVGSSRPLLIAVTVLTSLEDKDMADIGLKSSVADQAIRLAQLAQDCGLDGVVCSPHELSVIREVCGANFKLVVPGIRPDWAVKGDQKRIITPRQALDFGADYLVIGRPITEDEDPVRAAKRIGKELSDT